MATASPTTAAAGNLKIPLDNQSVEESVSCVLKLYFFIRVLYSLCNETLVHKLQEIAEKAYKLHASVVCLVVT